MKPYELLKEVCQDIAKRYQVKLLEIVTDQDHVHFSGAICADVQCDEYYDADETFDGARGFSSLF